MRKALVFLFLGLLPLTGIAQGPYPQLTEIVTDKAGIFTPDQLTDLRAKLTRFETETTPSIGGIDY